MSVRILLFDLGKVRFKTKVKSNPKQIAQMSKEQGPIPKEPKDQQRKKL